MSAKDLYIDICKKLKTETVWTKEQAEIYSTLKLLVQEHTLCKRFYKVNSRHKEFLDYMTEQDWYKQDKDKLYVLSILKSCMLLENPINEPGGIKITLFFKGFETCLNGFYDKKIGLFYVYFSKNNKEPAYLAYFNTHKDTKEQHSMRLPDFEKIYEVTEFLDTMFKKSSLIRLVVDVFRFYNCETLLHHAIGIRYDVTLEQIYSKIHA